MTGRRSLSGQALVFLLPLLFALAAAVLWAAGLEATLPLARARAERAIDDGRAAAALGALVAASHAARSRYQRSSPPTGSIPRIGNSR